jgi:hypothetical protein
MKLYRANSVKSGVARLKPKDEILVVCPRLLSGLEWPLCPWWKGKTDFDNSNDRVSEATKVMENWKVHKSGRRAQAPDGPKGTMMESTLLNARWPQAIQLQAACARLEFSLQELEVTIVFH